MKNFKKIAKDRENMTAREISDAVYSLVVSQQIYREVVESTPTAMIMIDKEGKVQLMNKQAEELFGYERDELLEQPVEMLVPETFRANHPELRANFFKDPSTRRMGVGRDLYGVRKDGSEFPIEIGLNPVETDLGIFVISSIVDITERKEAEDEMKRSNQELEQFAYVTSHDLQEPLRMMASYCQLLDRQYGEKLDSEGQEYLTFVREAAARMQDLIRDLLAYSRVGRRETELVDIDVNSIVSNVLQVLQSRIQEIDAKIEVQNLLHVPADGTLLSLVFQNLLSNALKFRREDTPPEIVIASRQEENSIVFSVQDNGIGIEKEYADKIFDIFKRLHTRDDIPGTGLGLAISRKIIDRHHGEIWLESELGKGTTFFFRLPLVSKED